MSGFEYYEFQVIDRKLTKEEINKIGGLSSRSRVNKNRAIFTYNYGSFRGNTEELLLNHFDAFLYTSNFGTKELSFRIPTSLFNAQALCLYEYEYAVEVETYGDSTIVKLQFNDDEAGGWVGEEDCLNLLDDMLPIRENLIKGDPRALYLTLLAHKDRIESDGKRDEKRGNYLQSLPIPPNLKKLDSALETLVTFFEIPNDVLQEAAQKSSDIEGLSLHPAKILTLLSRISAQEKDAFLLKVLQGDAHVAIELNNKLQERTL
jgi:hypothetical protein